MLRKESRNTEAPHINIQSPKKTSQHTKFSHKKKYCGIKDIRVLFYSSIFQVIIFFLFIVLKYFSFCCHSSHSVLCCNHLVYSCFILFVKSDSNFNLNFSCQLSILFNLFVIHLCLQPVFVFIILLFLFQFVFCFFHSVFLLLCLFSYFVFMSFCLLLFCLFSSFCRTSSFLFSHFGAYFLHFHLFIF